MAAAAAADGHPGVLGKRRRGEGGDDCSQGWPTGLETGYDWEDDEESSRSESDSDDSSAFDDCYEVSLSTDEEDDDEDVEPL